MPKKSKKIVSRRDSEGNVVIYFGYHEIPSEYLVSGVNQCCKGKLKKYKGFEWSYVEASILRTCTICNEIIHNGNKVNLKKTLDGKFFRCITCNRDVGNQWHRDNYEERYPKIKDSVNKRNRDSYSKLKQDKGRYQKFLERARESSKKYRNTSKGKANRAANEASRRASKLNATPNWLSEFDLDYIKSLYVQAHELSNLGEENYHVDHIIPLRGKSVRGLHVPWNLQILEAVENIKKNNKVLEE